MTKKKATKKSAKKVELKTYTMIGFYPDTKQRWADSAEAESPEDAELQAPDGVMVCGVIEGDHQCVDTEKMYIGDWDPCN